MGVLGTTQVLTDEGYIKISDLKVGTIVMTHSNRYLKVVNKKISKLSEDLYKLDVFLSVPLYVSGSHLILTDKNETLTVNSIKKKSCVVVYCFNYNEATFYDVEVKGICIVPSKDEFVYDLRIEGDNSFIGNGIVLGGMI